MQWLYPWYPDGEPGLVSQLRDEMAPGHVLEKETDISLVARRHDQDGALFLLSGGRVAEVNLTWRRTRETNAAWPATKIFASLETWAEDVMTPMHHSLDPG